MGFDRLKLVVAVETASGKLSLATLCRDRSIFCLLCTHRTPICRAQAVVCACVVFCVPSVPTIAHRGQIIYRSLSHIIDRSLSRFFKAYMFPILYDLAHIAGWDPYILHDLDRFSLGWMCSTVHRYPAQPLRAAGEDLDDLL